MKVNKRFLTLRIISAPFILCILVIAHNFFVLERFWHYLKFGGEYINFEKEEKRTIKDIYEMLQEIKDERKNK